MRHTFKFHKNYFFYTFILGLAISAQKTRTSVAQLLNFVARSRPGFCFAGGWKGDLEYARLRPGFCVRVCLRAGRFLLLKVVLFAEQRYIIVASKKALLRTS